MHFIQIKDAFVIHLENIEFNSFLQLDWHSWINKIHSGGKNILVHKFIVHIISLRKVFNKKNYFKFEINLKIRSHIFCEKTFWTKQIISYVSKLHIQHIYWMNQTCIFYRRFRNIIYVSVNHEMQKLGGRWMKQVLQTYISNTYDK